MRYVSDLYFAFDVEADMLACAAAVEGFPGLSLGPGESLEKGADVGGVWFVRGRLGFSTAEEQAAFGEALVGFRGEYAAG